MNLYGVLSVELIYREFSIIISKMSKHIVNFYIDGFNIYHRINFYQQRTDNCYKWLNYRSLLDSLLDKDTESPGLIYFFTAIPRDLFSEAKIKRHETYIKALDSVNIKIKEGKFRPEEKIIYTRSSGYYLKIGYPLEKQTDVNIVTHMLRHAYTLKRETVSRLYLLSGDMDFIPALREINRFTDKEVGIVTRPYDNKHIKRDNIKKLENQCSIIDVKNKKHLIKELKFDNMKGYSFPKKIELPNGDYINMPKEYQTF